MGRGGRGVSREPGRRRTGSEDEEEEGGVVSGKEIRKTDDASRGKCSLSEPQTQTTSTSSGSPPSPLESPCSKSWLLNCCR